MVWKLAGGLAALALMASPAAANDYQVTNTMDQGAGSLHQAIQDANAHAGPDRVTFAIGSGAKAIVPTTQLYVHDPLLVDGTTQPGYAGTPLIVLVGTGLPAGITVAGNDVRVRGLAIADFTFGIRIQSGCRFVLEGSRIGTNPAGTAAPNGNTTGVIDEGGCGEHVIGGPDPEDANVISGNRAWGLYLPSPGNAVEGNRIGTDLAGTAAVPNRVGVLIGNAGETEISSALDLNVISGNTDEGVDATATYLQGNRVGVAANGAPLGNGHSGLLAHKTVAGVVNTADANLIAHNGAAGVSGSALLRGNRIFANAALGIDADPAGVTVEGQPVVTSALIDAGMLHVTGTAPAGAAVEAFLNEACDPSGYGEGETLLGRVTAAADGAWTLDIASDAAPGRQIAATATTAGRTSEFSACRAVTAPAAPPVQTAPPSSPPAVPGGTQQPPATSPVTPSAGACARVKRGTRRADRLLGTRSGDRLRGLAGNDVLEGGRGADCLHGGRGNDRLVGGPGRDRLVGGAGNDRVDAVDGARDVVLCGPGRDRARLDRRDRARGCERVRRVRR